MEERLRTLTLRVRWRLIAGMVSAILVVGLTLPVLSSGGNPGARAEVIWPNGALSSEVIWPNGALTSEVIWPNGALTSEVIWPNVPLTGGALGQG